jgi:DNA-binding transcriptional ArsR family regulator
MNASEQPSLVPPPLFRSDVQFRLLGELFTSPEPELGISELAVRAKTSHPTASREVARLKAGGLVRARTVGRRTLVSTATDSPLYSELRSLLAKTYGPLPVIREEFAGLAEQVIVFGSYAARWSGHAGPAPNDIDVLVITDAPPGDVWSAAARASRRLRLDVSPVIRTAEEWETEDGGIATSIRTTPTIEIELPAVTSVPATTATAEAGRWG